MNKTEYNEMIEHAKSLTPSTDFRADTICWGEYEDLIKIHIAQGLKGEECANAVAENPIFVKYTNDLSDVEFNAVMKKLNQKISRTINRSKYNEN